MWHTLETDQCSGNWEPLELRLLKRKLANNNCKCKSCTGVTCSPYEEPKHRAIQVNLSNVHLERFIQATPMPTIAPDTDNFKTSRNITEYLRKDVLCPSCYLNLNYGGVTRVLKDEEIETKLDKILGCDKSTEHVVQCLEKTSLTARPVLKSSSSTLYDHIEELPSQASDVCSPQSKKSSHREVTFMLERQDQETGPVSSDGMTSCICLDDYIDMIRPPIPPWH